MNNEDYTVLTVDDYELLYPLRAGDIVRIVNLGDIKPIKSASWDGGENQTLYYIDDYENEFTKGMAEEAGVKLIKMDGSIYRTPVGSSVKTVNDLDAIDPLVAQIYKFTPGTEEFAKNRDMIFKQKGLYEYYDEMVYYTDYRPNKEISKIKEEVENNLKNGKYDLSKLEDILTPNQTEQIKKLEEMYKNSNNEVEKAQIQQSINEKRTSKLNELNSMVKDNQFLNKAVYEAEMSLQKYSYDDKKVTDEYEKGARDSATKFANNTTETRNFVDNISKLAKDRQTHYRFTNNQELLEQGDLVENTNLSKEDKLKLQTLEEELKTVSSEREELEIKSKINEIKYLDVGGFVRKNIDGVETVLINVDSKQSLSAVVGHETKHLLEKNSLNKEFNELLFAYAESKGDLKAYRERVERLYEGIENADIDGEVAAALTGDYLFTDSQFVENLLNSNSTNSKSIFQKIKERIKPEDFQDETNKKIAIQLYEELEKEGFIYTLPAKGCYVAPKNIELLREENLKKIEEHIEQIAKLAASCNLSRDDIIEMITFGMEEQE